MTTQAHPSAPRAARRVFLIGRRALLPIGLVGCAVLLMVSLVWGIMLGAADISPQTVYEAVFPAGDALSLEHTIIQTARLPRVLAGALVGAALAVAGALMQGVTRNPLADSGLLGINSGAALAVVLLVTFIDATGQTLYAAAGFVGAGVAATLVYAIGSAGRGGATPLRLTLAGVIFSAFVSSFTTAILIGSQEAIERIRFWTAGSLAGRDMALVGQIAPYVAVGLLGSWLLSRQITTLSLGDEVAVGLGQNTARVKLLAAVMVVLLAGSAVALAGPVGFVGLVVPHVVRMLVGSDYRWVIPYSALGGAILVTLADALARMVIRPQELPVGVVMAFIGAPFFIGLARWKVKR